jgi:hypothetical protein
MIGGAGGGLGSVATGGIIPTVGFAAGAGGLAAGMQAAIGAGQAGGAFAMLQNMGAIGAFAGPAGLLAGTALGLGVVAGKKIYDKVQ